jgi:hypothetical protein
MKKQYIVGIDLGTSNTVVAYTRPAGRRSSCSPSSNWSAPARSLRDRCCLRCATIRPPARSSPANCNCRGRRRENGAGDHRSPGARSRRTGSRSAGGQRQELAVARGGRPPGGRSCPGAPKTTVAKVSPVGASASYLAHVRAAWLHRFPQAPLEQQQVILTVPASFDEGARALTLAAARQAGLPNGCACSRNRRRPSTTGCSAISQRLADELAATRLLLVCDVGGGTTDLTLIQVAITDGEPVLTRIGVGDHLMLGGDNMDLALAHLVESRLPASEGAAVGGALFAAHRALPRRPRSSCSPPARRSRSPDAARQRLAADRRRAHRRTASATKRARSWSTASCPRLPPTPRCSSGARRSSSSACPTPPIRRSAAIIAAFLRRHAAAARQALADAATSRRCRFPTRCCLNGGVFRAAALAERLQIDPRCLAREPLRVLHNDRSRCRRRPRCSRLCARREGHGRRIGGGSARSYFLVLDEGQARRGICLLPRGSEEGHEIPLPERSFSLRLGQPVRFHLASSVADTAYLPARSPHLARRRVHPAAADRHRRRGTRRQQPARGARATDDRDE